MKKSIIFLLILLAIFFTSTLYLLYLNFFKTHATIPISKTGGIPTESSIPTTILTSDSTADWKTYENKQYGFEFKYPENQFNKSNPIVGTPNGCQKLDNTGCVNPERYEFYVVKSCGNGECNNIIGLTVFPDPNSPTFKRDSTDMTGANSLTSITNSTIGGLPAKKRSYGSLEDVYGQIYYITTDKYSFVIHGIPNDPVFNQILSTFKFTQSPVTSDLRSQVENWTSYAQSPTKLSWDKCGGESTISSSLKGVMSVYPVFIKEINGLKLAFTSKLDFTAQDVAKFTLCEAGNFYPIYTFNDKILWTNACSTGITPDNPKCEDTLTQVEKLYGYKQ